MLKNFSNTDGIICKKILRVVNIFIKYIDCVLSKRIYINIIVVLLSVGLVCGYYYSINDKEYRRSTYKTFTEQTKDKVKSIGNTFLAKTQNQFDTSIKMAYKNSKNAINKKSFHQFPKLHIRSKTSLIETFTKKSFNTIDDSKNLRWGELKWKLFSKIQ